MILRRALRADNRLCLALVGSGGKTTAMFQLARQLDAPVLVSTSTHLAVEQRELADRYWAIENPEQISSLQDELFHAGIALVTGPVIDRGRLSNANPVVLNSIYQLAEENNWPLLIEADGSRRLPLKAPADHEPAIPDWVNTVMVCVGLSCLNQPLDEDHVFRSELFASITGTTIGQTITGEMLVQYLSSPRGGLKIFH